MRYNRNFKSAEFNNDLVYCVFCAVVYLIGLKAFAKNSRTDVILLEANGASYPIGVGEIFNADIFEILKTISRLNPMRIIN